MSEKNLFAVDWQGRVFFFDPRRPDVKHWRAPGERLEKLGDYNELYLVYGQWYRHAGDIFSEMTLNTRPNYATFLTLEHARDWFLAVGVPIPDELADLRPTAFPTPLSNPEYGKPALDPHLTLSQAAALVHRSKRTLETYKGRGLPRPSVRGGGGKPNLWAYSEIRPWLIKTFDIQLPEQFPADRNAERN